MESRCPYPLIQTIAEKAGFYGRQSCHEDLGGFFAAIEVSRMCL